MAQILKSLSLDVSRQNRVRTILAKQFDNNSRFLKVQLNNEGEPIVVEKDSIVLINATREDGKSDSFFGYVNDDGSVTVPISYWMLEVTGKVKCDISVISEQGSKLSTLSFAIEVEKTNGCGESIEEHEDCGILVQLISDVKQLEEKFKTVFIRYSANADGGSYSDIWSEGMEYIGIANADSEPADKSGYVWCRFAVPKESNNITVDSELSLESENPVQNKVIKAAFDSTNRSVSSIFQRQEEMGNHLDSLQNQVDNMGGGSGGVSSWDDLTDKPFDDNVTTIFDGVLQDTQSGDTWMGEPSAEDTSDAALVVGQTYTYTWDGKEYTSVCFSLEGINCIGNNAPVSGVDNGHPVLIFRHPTKWEAIVINNRNDTDGTYSLKITTAIKQLDNKYLEPFELQAGDVNELLPSCKGATTYSSDYGVYGLSTPSTVEMFARSIWSPCLRLMH